MPSDKKLARELIEMALKDEFEHFDTPYLAIQHVYLMAQERELPWARHEVEDLAFGAFEQAEITWLNGRAKGPNLKSVKAELEAARGDGFDLREIALKHLADD